jgi:hypothetical protein
MITDKDPDAVYLPEWFVPKDKDVICGWARQVRIDEDDVICTFHEGISDSPKLSLLLPDRGTVHDMITVFSIDLHKRTINIPAMSGIENLSSTVRRCTTTRRPNSKRHKLSLQS